jgi:hypothetical protein
MNIRPRVIGYVDKELSGLDQENHENHIREIAKLRSNDLARTLAVGRSVTDPAQRLLNMIGKFHAPTVYLPRIEHLGVDVVKVNAVCEIVECEEMPPKVWKVGKIENADVVVPTRGFSWLGQHS